MFLLASRGTTSRGRVLDFDRPTTPDDIVTFDFAGNVGGGLAMFNDATSYNAGVGAPKKQDPGTHA